MKTTKYFRDCLRPVVRDSNAVPVRRDDLLDLLDDADEAFRLRHDPSAHRLVDLSTRARNLTGSNDPGEDPIAVALDHLEMARDRRNRESDRLNAVFADYGLNRSTPDPIGVLIQSFKNAVDKRRIADSKRHRAERELDAARKDRDEYFEEWRKLQGTVEAIADLVAAFDRRPKNEATPDPEPEPHADLPNRSGVEFKIPNCEVKFACDYRSPAFDVFATEDDDDV
jgi:hypothetical protein